ncbi:hypothetical protein [Mesorhizobium huakuii]|uniref:hypothetical protein n=1 Tax=Mesorhizobium huakuii TaxID=28104 RepID=UPI0024E09C20|nr:hypothetical protein [Mesorhizobium huakuii]
MAVYVVAEMHFNRMVRSQVVEAASPAMAASEMNARKTVFKRWSKDWIRVTDEVGGQEFAYTIARRKNSA